MREERSAVHEAERASQDRFTQALLHRWLVQYNPLYLLSAALVFGGLTLISREVAAGDSLWAHLGGAVIAEAYAFTLILGAALLVRLGQRRPATMLGLLAMLFAGDLVLHVETCSYLGVPGKLASAAWLLLFFLKLHLLARALELRVSRSAVAVAALGVTGFAVLPHALRVVGPDDREVLVAAWLFALGTAAVFTRRDIASAVGWDIRGRRCVHGAWAMWAVLVVGHTVFWASDYRFDLGLAVLATPLVAARYARRESIVWLLVGLAVFMAARFEAQHLWVVSLMAAVTLVLAATRGRLERTRYAFISAAAPPYRSYEPLHEGRVAVIEDLSPYARPRLYVGAALTVHLAATTSAWSGGALPAHHLWLDALFVLVCVLAARHWQRPHLLLPLGPLLAHLAFQRGWVAAPTTLFHWGAASIGLGFALLVGSLGTTYRLVRRFPAEPRERESSTP